VRSEYLSEGGNPKTHIVMTTGTSDLNEAHLRVMVDMWSKRAVKVSLEVIRR
jgi:hypothetical protein